MSSGNTQEHSLLSGLHVVVTGAGQGNGRAIAIGMARAGAKVTVLDVDLEKAENTAADCGAGAIARELDVADRRGAADIASQIGEVQGAVDCVVNNAGILLRGAIDDDKAEEAWDRTLAVNLGGTYNVTRAFLPQLKQQKGSIINIGSIQSFVATPNSVAYTASKGAILQLTKALAAELAPFHIRVNGIAPGVMRTPMSAKTFENEEKLSNLLRHIPLGRGGEPEELVGPAVFLASSMASYVTGAMLPVDGGYLVV